MIPVPNNDAVASNNHNHQFSLMLENPLRNPGHRRFFYELPSSSNDAYFGGDFASASGGANASGNSAFMSDDFDDEAFARFFELHEPDTSSATMAQSNANISAGEGVLDAGLCTQQMGNSTHQCNQSKDKIVDVSRIATSSTNRTLSKSRKKNFSPNELAEIFLVDPGHAKRILTQRKSVAKVKERKEKYKAELEERFQFLESKVASMRTRLAEVKNEVSDLTKENKMLHLRLQAMEQHFQLQGALNDMLNGEIKCLKLLNDQASNAVLDQG